MFLCVHGCTDIHIVPSSYQLTGSEGTQRRPPEWRDLSFQPAVSSKALPLQGATASLPLWETWRSQGWVPLRPTEQTITEFSQTAINSYADFLLDLLRKMTWFVWVAKTSSHSINIEISFRFMIIAS